MYYTSVNNCCHCDGMVHVVRTAEWCELMFMIQFRKVTRIIPALEESTATLHPETGKKANKCEKSIANNREDEKLPSRFLSKHFRYKADSVSETSTNVEQQ